MVMGDINVKVGHACIEGVIASFGMPGVDENRECLSDMCAAKGVVVEGT